MISIDKINQLTALFIANKEAMEAEGQGRLKSLGQLNREENDNHKSAKELRNYIEGLNREEVLDLITLLSVGQGEIVHKQLESYRQQAEDHYLDDCPEYLLENKNLDKHIMRGAYTLGLTA
jgi:hypothetical protein